MHPDRGFTPILVPFIAAVVLVLSAGGYKAYRMLQSSQSPFHKLTEDQCAEFAKMGGDTIPFEEILPVLKKTGGERSDGEIIQKSIPKSDTDTRSGKTYTQGDIDNALASGTNKPASIGTIGEILTLAEAAYRQGLDYQELLDLAREYAQELLDERMKQDPCEYFTREQVQELVDTMQQMLILGAEGPVMDYLQRVLSEYLPFEAASLGPTDYVDGFDPSTFDPDYLSWEEFENMLPTENNQTRVDLAQTARMFDLEDLSRDIIRGNTGAFVSSCPGFSVHAKATSHSDIDHMIDFLSDGEEGLVVQALRPAAKDLKMDIVFVLDAYTCEKTIYSVWRERLNETQTMHPSGKITQNIYYDQYFDLDLTSGRHEISLGDTYKKSVVISDNEMIYTYEHTIMDPVVLKGQIKRGASECTKKK